MRFFIDNNLSPGLRRRLPDLLGDAGHTRDLGRYRDVPDEEIWAHAAANDLVILTRDRDFERLSRELGHPPKVVLYGGFNRSTPEIAAVIIEHRAAIEAFLADPAAGLLEID